MHTPSSKYLSRQPAILKGLTLNELCLVIVLGLITGSLSGFILGIFVGFKAVFSILGLLFGGLLGYFALSKVLFRLKGHAPFGFLKKRLLIGLSSYGLIQNPYRHYEGVWLKSRKLKG